MPWQKHDDVQTKCYPSAGNTLLRIVGFIFIGLGLLLILFCVPGWAWLAAIGAALVLLGLLLIRK